MLADVTMVSVRPSILSATATVFGLRCSKKHILSKISTGGSVINKGSPSIDGADIEKEIDACEKAWKELVKELLREISDYSELEDFLIEISQRAAYIKFK